MRNTYPLVKGFVTSWPAAVCSAAWLLSACGGGGELASGVAGAASPLIQHTVVLESTLGALPDDLGAQMAQPLFHLAPALPAEPDDIDTDGQGRSARRAPSRLTLYADQQRIDTRRLSPQALQHPTRGWDTPGSLLPTTPADAQAQPLATTATASIYTPAQIRAAYGLPALPSNLSGLSAAQAAQLGAGQTIYVIGAKHNPNVAAELAAFNQRFGLPTCTTLAIPATTKLPLVAAPTTGCQLSVAYSTAAGALTSTVPAYEVGWATEMALDVQWAHATAPLARIILVEAPDASLNNLLGAIQLANAMGPGVVSMSFGSLEGSWTASADSAFATANMTYLAATGDSGAAVSWPAVSSKVVAVGGTTLTYAGTGTRSEASWSGTGGGVSLYTLAPSYQTTAVPGMATYRGRSVADVSFNADPASGQYVATQAPGASTVSWISAGGTSLACPQWAGLLAVANAVRAVSAKAALGSPHEVLYRQIATVPGTYASAFADITRGANGTCTTCLSKTGYDTPTGLGTPNVGGLMSALAGASLTAPAPSPAPAPVAPVVASASVSGTVGKALSFNINATSANAMSYTLTGAPTGMAVNSTGTVSWATPVAGSYAVIAVAKDSKTGLSGQGSYTVTISKAGLVIAAPAVNGIAGKALSGSITISAPGATYISTSISGAPWGMGFSSTGLVINYSWASPVTGSYTLKVVVTDSSGQTAQASVPITVAAK
ncbi:MAG: peptidase S53 [Burkholderiales bacterium PBB4]|nr:MAG: peptidase S53 [Burkholderiales bacterium PBB4]